MKSTTILLLLAVTASMTMADDALIELHERFLNDEQMEAFHRHLRWNSWYQGLRGGHGGHQDDQQGWHGRGGGQGERGGGGGGGLTSTESTVIDALLDNRDDIRRSVTPVYHNGDFVGTLANTTSHNPTVTGHLQSHVHQMKALVDSGRSVRRRDPLYRELLDRRGQIAMSITNQLNGVSVLQTSSDDCTAALIRDHSETVTGFVERGRAEVRANHPVPAECF